MIEPLFRPSQHEILGYRGGLLGVIAVPGAGKTFTLAHLAAKLIQRLGERKDAEHPAGLDSRKSVASAGQ